MLTIECKCSLRLAYAVVGEFPADDLYRTEDFEAAFQHLKRCAECRNSFSPEEHERFIRGVVLERE
jgi:hypothetical protein